MRDKARAVISVLFVIALAVTIAVVFVGALVRQGQERDAVAAGTARNDAALSVSDERAQTYAECETSQARLEREREQLIREGQLDLTAPRADLNCRR